MPTPRKPPRPPRHHITHQTWRQQAACANDPDPTWITQRAAITEEGLQRARGICATCPVLTPCHAHHTQDWWFEGVAAGQIFDAPRSPNP